MSNRQKNIKLHGRGLNSVAVQSVNEVLSENNPQLPY